MEMLFKDGRPRHLFFISEAFWEPQSISGDAGRRIRAPALCHQRVQTNQGERPPAPPRMTGPPPSDDRAPPPRMTGPPPARATGSPAPL